jgi:hypothetical protein
MVLTKGLAFFPQISLSTYERILLFTGTMTRYDAVLAAEVP